MAIHNSALRHGLLSLGALWQCKHLLKDSPLPEHIAPTLNALLMRSWEHEMESQRHMGLYMASNNCQIQNILAHAAMMVMLQGYGYAVRFYIGKLLRPQTPPLMLSCKLRPLQWISYFLMLGMAFDQSHCTNLNDSPLPPPIMDAPRKVMLKEGFWPTPNARVSGLNLTFDDLMSVLKDLRFAFRCFNHRETKSDWQPCSTAFHILEELVAEILEKNMGETSKTTYPKFFDGQANIPTDCLLSKVPNELRLFVCQIMVPGFSHRQRWLLFSFLRLVPTRFLSIITSVLGEISVPGVQFGYDGVGNGRLMLDDAEDISSIDCWAVDIFSTWMALVMVADDMRWMKLVGLSELRRIISLMNKSPAGRSYIQSRGGPLWWPRRVLNQQIQARMLPN
ncbi:hypothetical protein HJFPF1_09328 [Paramyrothecium foliicola]|nr:hypothetical protein HJFPF1_09328 [Paramyrothecium foliicola]